VCDKSPTLQSPRLHEGDFWGRGLACHRCAKFIVDIFMLTPVVDTESNSEISRNEVRL